MIPTEDGSSWDGLAFDTRALGIRSGTPLLGFSVFDAPPGARPPAAFRDHGMLIVAEEGPAHLRQRIDSRIVEHHLGSGDIVLIPSGVRLGFEWTGPLRGLGLWVDTRAVQDFARAEIGLPVDGVAFAGCPVMNDPEIVRAAHALRDAVMPDGPGRRLIFDSMSRVFLTQVLRKYGQLSDAAAAAFGPDRMRALRAHLQTSLTGSPDVPHMAAAVGMSASAFGRALRAATGLTPMGFVREMRIERAKEMLRGDAGLGEIAARCGFADQAHFSRSFKAGTGRTPRAWRLAERSEARGDAASRGRAAPQGDEAGTRPAAEPDQSASHSA